MRGGREGTEEGRNPMTPFLHTPPPPPSSRTIFLEGREGERAFSSGQEQSGVTKKWAWVVKKGGEVVVVK